ncbi:hypothetical protein D3C73_1129920 [compost metagenome]
MGELGNRTACIRLEWHVADGELGRQPLAGGKTVILRLDVPPLVSGNIAASHNPVFTQARKALIDSDDMGRIGIGAGTVVDGDRRLAGCRVKRDLAHRHAEIGILPARNMDLGGSRKCARGNGRALIFGGNIHREAPSFKVGDPVLEPERWKNADHGIRVTDLRIIAAFCTVPTPV